MRRIWSWYHGVVRRVLPGGAEIRRRVGAAALLVLSCAPAREPPVASRLPPAPPRWAEFEGARTWPLAAEPFASRGHGGGHYTVEVRVTPAALPAYRALVPGRTLPVGTEIAAFHRSVDGGAPGSTYVMQKRAEGWAFFATDAAGRVLVGEGVRLCAGCHAEARADSLFGVPSPALDGPPATP